MKVAISGGDPSIIAEALAGVEGARAQTQIAKEQAQQVRETAVRCVAAAQLDANQRVAASEQRAAQVVHNVQSEMQLCSAQAESAAVSISAQARAAISSAEASAAFAQQKAAAERQRALEAQRNTAAAQQQTHRVIQSAEQLHAEKTKRMTEDYEQWKKETEQKMQAMQSEIDHLRTRNLQSDAAFVTPQCPNDTEPMLFYRKSKYTKYISSERAVRAP